MDSVLDGGGQLERAMKQDPFAAPATGSLVLHAALFGLILFFGFFNGLMHHNWGAPLPSDQPKNDNVLPTEKPSPAPPPPAPKAKQTVDETAIPIQGKAVKPEKQKQVKTAKVQPPKPDNRVQYGEQAGSKVARSTFAQPSPADQPVSVTNGDFGTRFPWYVEGIKRKVSQNWNRFQVDQRTPKGALVQIYFKVNRQGVPTGFRVNTSSGSPTLDRSCMLATQRVDTFGDLPRDSNDQWLDVTYDCTY
jgi:protein TonB